jgi:hypothetical protein
VRITARRLEDLGHAFRRDRARTAPRGDQYQRTHDADDDPRRAGRKVPLPRSGRLARGTAGNLCVAAASDPRTPRLAVVTGVAALTVALQAGAGAGRPRTGAEGAHLAVAWAVERLSTTADATFSPTVPSLGSLQLAAWTWATHAFTRTAHSAVAGREAMLLATAAGIAVLWVLARRAGLAPWAAAISVATFGLSPLAVELRGSVHMANLAVPWALAAFAFASSPHNRSLTCLATGGFLAIAVLTEPVTLALVPAITWQLWRSTVPSQRRRRLATASAALAVPIATVLAFAAGGAPGAGSSLSVLGRLRFVFALPAAAADDADLGVSAARSILDLVALDPVTTVVATIAAAATFLAVPRLRPVGCAFGAIALTVLVGATPTTAAIAMLPLGAVLIGAAAQSLWTWHSAARAHTTIDAPAARQSRAVAALDAAAPAALTGLAALSVLTLPLWAVTHHRLSSDGTDTPLRQTEAWVTANVPTDQRVIVDDALWIDLVEAGFPAGRLAGYGAVGGGDDDSETTEANASGLESWRSYDYLVATEPAAVGLGGFDQLDDAIASSMVVATFGDGDDQVEIRRIVPDGPRALRRERAAAVEARVAAGSALATNPAIDSSPGAAEQLRRGGVDVRVLAVLATLATDYQLAIAGFPAIPGEHETALPARRVDLSSIDGRAVAGDDPLFDELVAFLEGQNPEFRATDTAIVPSDQGEPLLRITFALPVEPAS